MKKNMDKDKVENLESYFKNHHYEDSLISDIVLEKEVLQEEEDLSLFQL